MDDLKAIRLFIKDGGLAHEWAVIDEAQRLPYRLLATQKFLRETHEPQPIEDCSHTGNAVQKANL